MSGKLEFKWNPKDLEIKTKSVERQLAPLVIHVTTLVNSEKTSKKRSGKSKKGGVLVTILERAINNFIEKGEQIANEKPDFTKDMMIVIGEVRTAGLSMTTASRAFVDSPCDSQKRSEMVKAARTLLSSVTRLLILADMIDVHLLLESIQIVEDDLEKLRSVSNQNDLLRHYQNFEKHTNDLLNQAAKRQQDLKDLEARDDIAAARAVLKKSSTMLLCATKAHISHPQVAAAKENREKVFLQICEAVETINQLVKSGTSTGLGSGKFEGVGKLGSNLEQFERMKEVRSKATLEQQLDEIVKNAKLISDSDTTKNERKEKILAGCDAVREALQGLINQSMKSITQDNKEMNRALGNVSTKTKNLRRQLHKAIADRISEAFSTTSPLLALVDAAQRGEVQEVETQAKEFQKHCSKLIEVANQVCDLSTNEDGVKMVRYAAYQLSELCPGVINSARILAQDPQGIDAKENMDIYKTDWENQVKILLDAVDDITTIDDVLSVLENHILDDMNQCLSALQERNPEVIKAIADHIRGRANRICDVAGAEMDNYEPCPYTRKVLEAIKVLNEKILDFDAKTEKTIEKITKNPDAEVDENDFIDTTRLVYDGVREVRRAVLMNRTDDELDPEEVELEDAYETHQFGRAPQSVVMEDSIDNLSGITVARQTMGNLPEEQKIKILQQVENFKSEKVTFDREVEKWDDAGNDIIALAKYMCMIMMQMTDFVRQKGPLKTTTDVINAAKKISETGTKLDKLTRQIADQCPESTTKKDLLAYLERVALYSHQISIISKVKADVQNTNEELILAGVESATSLIENAKNLMNAVVLTVKASYVASTKYSRHGAVASPIVVWRMKIPEKKPLVRLEKPKEVRAVVRRGSQRRPQNPVTALAEFQI